MSFCSYLSPPLERIVCYGVSVCCCLSSVLPSQLNSRVERQPGLISTTRSPSCALTLAYNMLLLLSRRGHSHFHTVGCSAQPPYQCSQSVLGSEVEGMLSNAIFLKKTLICFSLFIVYDNLLET